METKTTDLSAPWNEYLLPIVQPEGACNNCESYEHHLVEISVSTHFCEDCFIGIFDNKMPVECSNCEEEFTNDKGYWEDGSFCCNECESEINAK